eukprot:2793940-Ditylum_brightwellii.AAC.2
MRRLSKLHHPVGQSSDNYYEDHPHPIQHHVMKYLNHHQGSLPEITDAIHLHKLKQMLLHGQLFVQQAKYTTGGCRPVNLLADQGALEGQGGSGPVCSDGANIGNKLN